MPLSDDIRKQTFTKVMRGYSSIEVDEFLDFLAKKTGELEFENAGLRSKLELVIERLEQVAEAEKVMRSTIDGANARADKIVADADARAAKIIADAKTHAKEVSDSAKHHCSAILSDFDAKIAAQKALLDELCAQAQSFRTTLFGEYTAQIEAIDATVARASELAAYEEDYTPTVLEAMKDDLENHIDRAPKPVTPSIEDEIDFDAHRKASQQQAQAAAAEPSPATTPEEAPAAAPASEDDPPPRVAKHALEDAVRLRRR